MTDAEIDALTPERLRKEVALRVMGLCFHKNKTTYGLTYSCLDCGAKNLGRDVVVPDYPNDNDAALDALKKVMGALGAEILMFPDGDTLISVHLARTLNREYHLVKASGPTLAISACRVALRAVERMGVQSSA